MQLNRPKKVFFIATTITTVFILLLGSWWLYLTFKLSNELESMGFKSTDGDILNMVKWEGTVFFVLVLLITFAHMYMYFSDRKKSRSINLFFASLTHELKTPLASIKLQAQVLSEILEDISINEDDHQKVRKYVERLHTSSSRLEHELDKHLQLARVERDGVLNLKQLDAHSMIKKTAEDFKELEVKFHGDLNLQIWADEFAFSLMVRNILENSLRHNKTEMKRVNINLSDEENASQISVQDNGSHFTGNIKELGSLFYKHNSPKGSGLGLYMIKKLMNKMKGRVEFKNLDSLQINLVFKKHEQ